MGLGYTSPIMGGCWICATGNGYEDDDMRFSFEFDTYYHPSCLDKHGVDSVLEYERQTKSEHKINE